MALTLELQVETSVPIEVEGVVPRRVRELPMAEIPRIEIFHGNRKLPLGELFRVSGDPADERIVFEGDMTGVHWIGGGMCSGEIRVTANAGRHLGSAMTGGTIHVQGSAGDWTGGEMQGGLIHVQGDTGHLVGSAYRGSSRGMTGGTILVGGRVGNEAGTAMRRGLLAVGGDCGDAPAFGMLAGTILVFGESGIRPGAGMQRGTLGLLGPTVPRMLPTFEQGRAFRPQFMRIVLRELKRLNFPFDASLEHRDLVTWHGDALSLGRGEILVRA
jgi:formylmethanofuran dehydrogenase subunit C